MSINYYTGQKLSVNEINLDVDCVGCAHKGLDVVRPYIPMVMLQRNTYVAMCPQCHLLQACPMPDVSMLTELYAKSYREGGTTGYDEPEITNRHDSQAKYIIPFIHSSGERDGTSGKSNVNKNILDIGAGFGQLLSCLKEEFPEASMYATELDSRCLVSLEGKGDGQKYFY